MRDPDQRRDFLDFCYRFDANPYVCGMGKDNLLAVGTIPADVQRQAGTIGQRSVGSLCPDID